MVKLRTIDSASGHLGKIVLLRIDSDVDIEEGSIIDDTRLAVSLPTIELLLKKGANVNIVGHLGRPKNQFQISNFKFPISKEDKELSLEPVAEWFVNKFKIQSSKLKVQEIMIGEFPGWQVADRINILENIRFYRGEEENDERFARELAFLGDSYVNDAFAVSHREHASIVGITNFLPSYAGLHLEKEVFELSKILEKPKRPLAVLIGGAKIETKLPLVSKMHRVADYILVGGEIAEQTRILIKVQHEKIVEKKSAVLVSESNDEGTDITPKSIENFCQILSLADTIVWNGPVGVIQRTEDESRTTGEDSERGTRELAHFIVSTKAYKVVGGGDTLAYLRRIGLLDRFDFVSTGGGAMLEFLSGHTLPGLKALQS